MNREFVMVVQYSMVRFERLSEQCGVIPSPISPILASRIKIMTVVNVNGSQL